MAWGSKKQSLRAEMMMLNPTLDEQELRKLTRNQLKGRLYMMRKSDFNTKIDALIAEAKEQGMWLEPMFVRWTRQCSISSRS